MNDNATKSDIQRVENSVSKAHERIDKVADDVALMGADVGEIKGAIGVMGEDVHAIKNVLIAQASPSSKNNSELFSLMKWIVVALVVGGLTFSGMTRFSAKSPKGEVNVSRGDQD